MQVINSDEYKSEVLKSETPVVLEFSAKWCSPCKTIKGILEKLEQEYNGRVRFFTMDVEENSELVIKLKIKSVPTIQFIRNGKIVSEFVGSRNSNVIKGAIEEILSTTHR
jgi:thioredoxin 1